MAKTRPYTVHPGWRLLLRDAGIDPASVLRRSGLPADLFARDRVLLEPDDYHRLFFAIEAEADDPTLAIRLGSAISVEAFDPPIFAALCSPDLNTALARIARYKPLIGPMALLVDVAEATTTMTIEWPPSSTPPPASLILTELSFFVQLTRIATRERVSPIEVLSPHKAEPAGAFARFFGVPVKVGKSARLVFRADDAARPFLTANEKMWQVFEPELRRRLSDLSRNATTADRVRSLLLELLPGGAPSMADVAQRLGTSARTLQRRLHDEGESYQAVLDQTRLELASHYLERTALPSAEISYLLGFEDPNCFFRAYRGWTGQTPAEARARAGASR